MVAELAKRGVSTTTKTEVEGVGCCRTADRGAREGVITRSTDDGGRGEDVRNGAVGTSTTKNGRAGDCCQTDGVVAAVARQLTGGDATNKWSAPAPP